MGLESWLNRFGNLNSHLHNFLLILAPVSRIVKYFRHDGTPLITVGGYTFDFVEDKQTCSNEYHMLIRAGLLSFQTISNFMVDIMNEWVWDF